jgi:hypothetical protein
MAVLSLDEVRAFHDALSSAFYSGAPFTWRSRSFGVLTRARFDLLHGAAYAILNAEYAGTSEYAVTTRNVATAFLAYCEASGVTEADLRGDA